jgi:hypothetical protein
MTLSSESRNHFLSSPISFRSHFIPRSPIIALGRNYIPEKGKEIKDLYILHHEYIHYEDYLSWPCTSIGYFKQTQQSINIIADYYKHGLAKYKISTDQDSVISLSSKILINGSKISIDKPIGADILLEASSLLDFLLKPESELKEFSRHLAEKILNDVPLPENLPHFTGVKLIYTAVEKLRNIAPPSLAQKNSPYNTFFNDLPAALPRVMSVFTFGYAIIRSGYSGSNYNWDSVNNFVLSNYFKVRDTYTKILHETYSSVLIDNNYDLLIDILQPGIRDLSIVGFHSFINLSYLILYNNTQSLFIGDGRLLGMLLAPILNIVKLYEAMNSKTLSKYGLKKIFPEWVPVPVILYRNGGLSCVSLKFATSNRDDGFHYVWGGLKGAADHYRLYSWINMAFLENLKDCLLKNCDIITCPIFEWSNNVSLNDDDSVNFLNSFCGNCMNVGLEFNYLNGKTHPSEDFCSYKITTDNKKSRACYFHDWMKMVMRPRP